MLREFRDEKSLIADFKIGVGNIRDWSDDRVEGGRLGQIGLNKFFDAPIDMTNDRERGDGGIDLDVELTWRGLIEWVTCDAKCTFFEKRGKFFLVNASQVYPEHIYVAMLHNNVIAWPTAWVWGYELLDDTNRWDLRGHRDGWRDSEAYYCPRGTPPMHDMSELRAMFTGNSRPSTEGRRKDRYDWHRIPRNQRERDHPLTGQETALSRR